MKIKNIKALGFVEVLIAIAIVGIVSAVFLTIAGQAMKNLVRTERIESMSRIATDGANIAQEVANQDKSGLVLYADSFPKIEGCYIPFRSVNQGVASYYFEKDGESYRTLGSRESYVSEASDLYEDYFLVMCIDSINQDDTNWANVSFIVGDVNVAGLATTDSDIADFTYYAVIDL